MVDLTKDAPGPSDFAGDPFGALKEAFGYSIGFGIMALLLLIGYMFVARPLYGGFVRLNNVVTNADVDDSPVTDGEVF